MALSRNIGGLLAELLLDPQQLWEWKAWGVSVSVRVCVHARVQRSKLKKF